MKTIFTPFWLTCWSFGLALGWLLPNHYAPWVAFHSDAWIAGWLLLAAVVVVLRSDQRIKIHRITLVCAFILCIPFIQYFSGLLDFVGQTWIGTAYLFALLLSIVIGAHWESLRQNEALDGLFLAIGFASIISVALALYQWFGLSVDALELWIMGTPTARVFANFIQPNQFATFMLWGLLACAWGITREKIAFPTAILMAVFLLFGTALSQSRTAFVAIAGMTLAAYLWRQVWPNKKVLPSIVGLAAFYFVCALSLPFIADSLKIESGAGLVARTSGELRLPAYMLFMDAAIQGPVWGYGWGQTAVAQMAVADKHAGLGGIFNQAHNLFLDLILWCGIALGGLISLVLVVWFARKAAEVKNAQTAIMVMLIGVVGWHAMLELPLHYAYMLLPTGLVMGVLSTRLGDSVIAQLTRWQLASVLLMGVVLLGLITRDYLRIEENFYALRFEKAKIATKSKEQMLPVLLLNHMNEFVRMARTKPREGMGNDELDWMKKVERAYPSPSNMFSLTLALGLNGKANEAQQLVAKIRNMTSSTDYDKMRRGWKDESRNHPQLLATVWSDQ